MLKENLYYYVCEALEDEILNFIVENWSEYMGKKGTMSREEMLRFLEEEEENCSDLTDDDLMNEVHEVKLSYYESEATLEELCECFLSMIGTIGVFAIR